MVVKSVQSEWGKDCFTASHLRKEGEGRSTRNYLLSDKALCVILDRVRLPLVSSIVKSKPAHLFRLLGSSSSFVTIHAQWANPPWLTRLTLRSFLSLVAPQTKSASVAFRCSADTMNQSANDDDDDSLLLNLTPLNCRRGRSVLRGRSDEIPTRTQIAVRTISVDGAAVANVAFFLRHKHKQDEWTRRSKVCFRFFLAAVVSDKLDRVTRAKVLTLSS